VIDAVDHVLPTVADASEIASATAALGHAGPSAARSGKATNGEEFYFAAKIHLGDALFGAARGVPSGGVSAPIRLADGVHLVVVRKNVMARPQPFADVRDQVLAAWVKDNAKRLTEANERFLRKRADIQFAPGFD
jgi:parvulin-like peptidyl-prolyl isomerase